LPNRLGLPITKNYTNNYMVQIPRIIRKT